MFGRHKARCGGCSECGHGNDVNVRPYDGNGRYPQTGAYDPPSASMGGTRAFERNFDVNVWDGSAVSTVPLGRWEKGFMIRAETPVVKLAVVGPMYDPTDVRTWQTKR